MNIRQFVLLISCSLLIHVHLWGQFRGGSPNPYPTSPSQQQEEVEVQEPAYVNYFFLDDLDKNYTFKDTSLNDFEIYAPHRTFENAALNIGNIGSSAQRVEYQHNTNIFTDIGYHQYDIYSLPLVDFKFYNLNRPYNDLYFSPGGGQQNFQVKAKFSRNFANNLNFVLDFERIKQDGIYTDQNTKDTAFGLGFWKSSDSGNHDLFIRFTANNFNESHNGGLDIDLNNDPTYSTAFYRNQRASIPTRISGGQARLQHFTYSLDNFFLIKNKTIKVHQHSSVEHGFYRYGDDNTSTSNDSIVYQSYRVSTEGLRLVNRFVRINNSVSLGLNLSNFDLDVGLTYKLLRFDDTNNTNTFNDLALTGKLKYDLRNIGTLTAHSALAIGENTGNFLIDAQLKFNFIKNFDITGFLSFSRYDPSLIQRSVVVNNIEVFNNNFGKINSVSVGGQIEAKKLGLNLKFLSGILDNPIAYGLNALPYQKDGSTEYIQLSIQSKLKFWIFGLENKLLYQSFTDNVFQLPEVFSIHNVYLQTRLFKKRLLGRVGLLYYNTYMDQSLSFMPLNGQFYPSENSLEYYPNSEFYATFQVDAFRIFLRYDNFTDMFRRRVYYNINNHPQFDSKFRMGVRWIISD